MGFRNVRRSVWGTFYDIFKLDEVNLPDAGFAPDGDLPPAPTEVADAGVGILLGGWSKICCSFRKVLSSHRFLIYERMCPRLVLQKCGEII